MPKSVQRRCSVDHLTPDRVLDIAYCHHVASDPSVQATAIGALARRVVGDFESLCDAAPRMGRKWELLFALQQIVVSLAKGITRRKATFEGRLRVAEQEKDQQIRQIADVTRRAGILQALYRAALMGGLGYAAMSAIAPSLALGEKIQRNTLSFAAAIAFVLLASLAKAWLMSRRVSRIFEFYECAQSHAYREYQEGALDEYLRAKRDATHAWERYTGTPAEEWPGFETVIMDDLRNHKTFQEEREEIESDLLERATTALRKWRRRKALAARLGAARKAETDGAIAEASG